MIDTIANRQIRVFVSSTFEDMKAEREYLMKVVFPRLRKKAEDRYVSLIELDLRWGVTEEDVANGRIVQICLEEIENSHPFFIGLLGTRYGWCPSVELFQQNVNLLERFPWIGKDVEAGLSITEIEMQYGALRHQEDSVHACFLLRKDTATTDYRQSRLKNFIRKKSRYPFHEYSEIEEMGAWVEEQFSSILEKLFPKTNLPKLELDRMSQKAQLQRLSQVYIPNVKNIEALNDFIQDKKNRYLAVVGDIGSGKSSLVANWISALEKNSDFNILYHFVGNSDSDGDYRAIQSRLINEIRNIYLLEGENLNHSSKQVLQDLVISIADKKPLLLILDGLQNLTEQGEETAELLNWLPELPEGFKCILTTLNGDLVMKTCLRREYPIYRLQLLDFEMRKSFIGQYLSRYGKRLSSVQVDKIAEASSLENPMLLKGVLDELVCFGSHSELNDRIDYYLASKDVGEFYQRVITRAEDDYGREVVHKTLFLLTLSYEGLSETELLEISEVVPLRWSAFYCAFSGYFSLINGRIGIANALMAWVVEHRVLTIETRRLCQRQIISYFLQQDSIFNGVDTIRNQHVWAELVHQYLECGMMEQLHGLVLRCEVFIGIYQKDELILVRAWQALLSDQSGKYALNDYLAEDSVKWSAEDFDTLGCFILSFFNDYEVAIQAYHRALLGYRRLAATDMKGYGCKLSHLLYNLGLTFSNINAFEQAFEYYEESLSIHKAISKDFPGLMDDQLANILFAIANVHIQLRQYDSAERYIREALEIRIHLAEKNPDAYLSDVASSHNNLGLLYDKTHNFAMAENEYNEALKILRHLSIKDPGRHSFNLSTILLNLSALHRILGDFHKAEKENVETMEIRRNLAEIFPLKFLPDVADALTNLGVLHSDILDYQKSESEYSEALEIVRKLVEISPNSYEPKLAQILLNLGSLHLELKDFQKSELEYSEVLGIYRKLAEKYPDAYLSTVADALTSLGVLHSDILDYQKSEMEYSEALEIVRKLVEISPNSYEPKLAQILLNLGSLHLELKDFQKSELEYSEVLGIYRKLAEKYPDAYLPNVADILNNIGILYVDTLEYSKAESYLKESLAIVQNLEEDSPGLFTVKIARGSGNLAVLNYEMKKYSSAGKYAQESLRYFTELNKSTPGYYACEMAEVQNTLGAIYIKTGEYVEAEYALQNALENISLLMKGNDTAFQPEYARILDNLGTLHTLTRQYDTAKEELNEALKIRKNLASVEADAYESDVAETLSHLGELYTALHENAAL